MRRYFELVRNRYINQRFSIPSSGKTPPRPNIIVGLILSQTFMDIRKRYSADKFDDNQVWGMAELTAVSCIQTDFEHNSEDWSIGYEELEPRREMVKFIYQRRKNFRDYLEQLTDYFIKHPLKKGCR